MSTLVNKTLDGVRQDLFDRIEEKQEEYTALGWLPIRLNLNRGIVRGLIELWAWGLYQLYLFLALIFDTQAFADTATGIWLRMHCRQVNVFPKDKTKAVGNVVFYRSGTVGNVPIASGRIVRTLPDGLGKIYRYVTTADAVLQDGETEVIVPVVAEEYGRGSNVTAGQICEISTTVPGVEGVRNESDWLTTEGTDDEDDDSLRERYRLAWAALNGCTKYAYKSWALSVTGVANAVIMDQHPRGQGTVDVVVRGAAGIPTQGLVDQVDAVVQENKPINDDSLVKAPGAVAVTISGELEIIAGEPSAVVLTAENRVRALFSAGTDVEDVTALEIGQDLTMDMLTSVVITAGNIKKVNWSSPTDDVSVPADGLAVLSSIAFTWVWAEA